MCRHHDSTCDKVLRICRQANLKLINYNCLFQCTSISFFGEVMLLSGVSLDPREVQTLTAMPPPKCKNELQSFLGMINYLNNFTPMTAQVCKPLQKLTSVKTEWLWNGMYQDLYAKVKNIIRQDACIKFYDASKSLYLETDTYGMRLGASLLQVRDGMNCGLDKVPDNTALHSNALTRKSLSSMEQR